MRCCGTQFTYIDGYPAQVTTFRGETRDLVDIKVLLAIFLSPWGESFPITCSGDRRDVVGMRAICERIVSCVRIKRRDTGRTDRDP
jgi:hypothetical protein